jgi:hypothetical protein
VKQVVAHWNTILKELGLANEYHHVSWFHDHTTATKHHHQNSTTHHDRTKLSSQSIEKSGITFALISAVFSPGGEFSPFSYRTAGTPWRRGQTMSGEGMGTASTSQEDTEILMEHVDIGEEDRNVEKTC